MPFLKEKIFSTYSHWSIYFVRSYPQALISKTWHINIKSNGAVRLSEQVWLSYLLWHFHEGLVLFLSLLRVAAGALMTQVPCQPFFLTLSEWRKQTSYAEMASLLLGSHLSSPSLPLLHERCNSYSPNYIQANYFGLDHHIHRYKVSVCCTFCTAVLSVDLGEDLG